MNRKKLILTLSAAAAITSGTLIAQAQSSSTASFTNTSQQSPQAGIKDAADKEAARKQAKQAAANKKQTSTKVSYEQPLTLPSDI